VVRFLRYTIAVTAIASAACGPRAPRSATPGDTDGCAPGYSQPRALVRLGGPTNVLARSAIAAADGKYIVAGVLVDAAWSEEREISGEVRIYDHTGALIPPPLRAEAKTPLEAPVPVVLGGDRRGLIWGHAIPPAYAAGRTWPSDMYTELWFSQWQAATGWAPARRIVQAQSYVDWAITRTIRNSRGEPLIMVVVEDHVTERRIAFGPASDTLKLLPLPPNMRPFSATFRVSGDSVLAVVQVAADAAPLALVALHSTDRGNTWSPSTVFASTPRLAYNLRVHLDSSGTEHLVWRDGVTEMHHRYRSAANQGWVSSAVPGSDEAEQVFAGVSGIDSCGRLTIARQVFSDGTMHIQLVRWNGQSWTKSYPFQGGTGLYLFGGESNDGKWYIGWSGLLLNEDEMSLWIMSP
jgi:hypothetical protein